jgi:hypothetical protein
MRAELERQCAAFSMPHIEGASPLDLPNNSRRHRERT